MLELLVNDGIPSRIHRLNMFDDWINSVGIYTGYHKKQGTMTTMDLGLLYPPGPSEKVAKALKAGKKKKNSQRVKMPWNLYVTSSIVN